MFVYSRMKRIFVLLLLASIFGLCAACGAVPSVKGRAEGQVTPEQAQKMEFLNQIADDMYKKTMDGQFLEARSKLLQISDQIPKIQFEGVTSVAGINALTESITQAERIYNAVKFSPEDGKIAVAKIRLATDALTHKNQPMWLQYYKVLQNDVSALDQAVQSNLQQQAAAGLEKLAGHIAVIHPSLVISREPSEVEKLDTLMTVMRGQLNASPAPMRQVDSSVGHLRQIIDELFMKHKDAIAVAPMIDPKEPIIWSLIMGLIIVSVLSYAGWRMYQSGKHVVSVKQSKENEPM